MDIARADAMQWHVPNAAHREDGVEFKTLFSGEGNAPVNYWFTLVQVREAYHTPRHRHLFDQVRFMLDGGFGYGEQIQAEGSVGYFTEGTFYEQACDHYSFRLLLQVEGPGGMPYLRHSEMRDAEAALKREGEFVGGLYRSQEDDSLVEQDGFEALYTRASGIEPVYSEPRYDGPVITTPDRFSWQPLADQPGVSMKALGSFTERDLSLAMVRIEPDATYRVEADVDRPMLGYVIRGQGGADDGAWEPNSGLRVAAGTSAALSATGDETAEILLLTLPRPK